MTDEAIKKLAEIAMDTAVQGAQTFIRKHNLVVSADALAGAIKDEIETATGEALDDARAAYEAGMPDIAMQTFKASMMLAGIRAAKRASSTTN